MNNRYYGIMLKQGIAYLVVSDIQDIAEFVKKIRLKRSVQLETVSKWTNQKTNEGIYFNRVVINTDDILTIEYCGVDSAGEGDTSNG